MRAHASDDTSSAKAASSWACRARSFWGARSTAAVVTGSSFTAGRASAGAAWRSAGELERGAGGDDREPELCAIRVVRVVAEGVDHLIGRGEDVERRTVGQQLRGALSQGLELSHGGSP